MDFNGFGDGSSFTLSAQTSWSSPHIGARRQPLLPAPRWCFLVPQWPAEPMPKSVSVILFWYSVFHIFRPALVPRAAPVQAHFADTPCLLNDDFPPLDPLRLGFLLAGPGAPANATASQHISAGKRPKLWRWSAGHSMGPKKNPPTSRARRSAYGRALVKIYEDIFRYNLDCLWNLIVYQSVSHCLSIWICIIIVLRHETCHNSRQMHWP